MDCEEYVVNDIEAGFKIPDSITDDEAATLPTNIIAPLVGLFDDPNGVGIPAPWTEAARNFDYKSAAILIIGGGSNCGRYAVQLAKLVGIGTIVSVGGSEQDLKSYGATDVLNRHGGEEVVLKRIRKVVGDDLVYVFDAINPPADQTLGLNALSSTKKGKLARLLRIGAIDETRVLNNRAGFTVVDVLGLSQVKPELAYPFWERVPDYLKSGAIRPLAFTVKKGLTAGKCERGARCVQRGKIGSENTCSYVAMTHPCI
jgi:NADPH2:quinone reductase